MSKKIAFASVATVIGGIAAGVLVGQQVMAAAAAMDTKNLPYEKEGEAGGCGAPQKVVLDNEVTRVNLVSFPKGFDRCGGVKRRNHQLLVYLDPGDFTITRSGSTGQARQPNANANAAPRKPLEPGSAVYHERDSVVSFTHINNAYRILFIEMKK